MINRSFNKKKKEPDGILYGFIAVCLFAVIVIAISYNHTPRQNVGFFGRTEDLETLSEGWILYDGDNSTEITLPSKNKTDVSCKTVVLKNTLPEELPMDPTLMFRTSLQAVDVYVGGVLIYSYGAEKYRAFGNNNASIWNMIPIKDQDAGQEIKLVITSPYDDFKDTFNTFYVGSYASALSSLLHEYSFNFVIVCLTFLIGIALLIYYIFLNAGGVPGAKRMLYVASMAIATAAWEFTECKLTQIFVTNMAGFSAANFLFLAIIPIPMVLYVDQIENRFYHKIALPIECVLELNIIVQTVLQISGVADFYDMMGVTHALIIISSLTMVITLIVKYRKHREPGLLVLLLTITFLAIGGIIEIIFMYRNGFVGGTVLMIAVLIVMGTNGIESVRAALHTIQASKNAMEESAQKSTFLANMSHEIRTPMNAICAMSELLMNADELSAGNRDFARTIHSSAENLLDIINDLLDYSKISANMCDIVPEEYDLSNLLSDVREIIGVRAEEKGLKLNIKVNPDLPFELYGDQSRIRQILLNILNNAVKYTNVGEVTLKVDGDNPGDGKVRLKMSISDTGIGIKPEDMEGLFEAFVQVDRAKNRANEGTGLGLAISKALAVAMGGSISVESEYGTGSTFTVKLLQETRSRKTFRNEIRDYFEGSKTSPFIVVESGFETTGYYKQLLADCDAKFVTTGEEEISDEIFMKEKPVVLFTTGDHPYLLSQEFKGENPYVRAVGIAKPLEQVDTFSNCEIIRTPVTIADILLLTKPRVEEKEEVQFEAQNAKVMVVDDNVVNLRVMKEMLKKYAVKPTLCSNGVQAIEAMKLKKFDLIFMDHMMPGMDGVEATRQIRAIPVDGERVKIVALTANAVKGVDKMFKENGFDAFVAKPVSTAEIGKALKKNLPLELINEIK